MIARWAVRRSLHVFNTRAFCTTEAETKATESDDENGRWIKVKGEWQRPLTSEPRVKKDGYPAYFQSEIYFPDGPPDNSRFRVDLEDAPLHVIQWNKEKEDYEAILTSTRTFFDSKYTCIVGFAGAFVPESTRDHLKTWHKWTKVFKYRFPFDEIIGLSMNDPYVMLRYARKLGVGDKMTYIADWDGAMTKLLESELEFFDYTKPQPFTAVIIDNVIKIRIASNMKTFFFTESVHPEFLWRYCLDEDTACRVFL
jgi:peroxiredoxin